MNVSLTGIADKIAILNSKFVFIAHKHYIFNCYIDKYSPTPSNYEVLFDCPGYLKGVDQEPKQIQALTEHPEIVGGGRVLQQDV